MGEPDPAPEGITIDAVDWLPSGARSGLVRVRGRAAGGAVELPDLIIEHDGREHRFTSLPDPGGGREPGAWRGAYVVGIELVALAGDRLVLAWPQGGRTPLPPLEVVAEPGELGEEEPQPEGGEVVDRAVLAERRARRAEAAEAAQARIAREAMRAVEVLELRANEVEAQMEAVTAERDALVQQLREPGEPVAAPVAPEPDAPAVPSVPAAELAALTDQLADAQAREADLRSQVERLAAALAAQPEIRAEPLPSDDADARRRAERRADRLREALASTIVTVGQLRLQLHEAQMQRRTSDVASGASSVRLTVLERERAGLGEALAAARAELRGARAERDQVVARLDAADARAGEVAAARDEALRAVEERAGELREARQRVGALEDELAAVRAETERLVAEAVETHVETEVARRAAVIEEAAAAERAKLAARESELEAERAALLARVEYAEDALADAETACELAEARAVAAAGERRAAEVAHAAALERALAARPVVAAPAAPEPASPAAEPASPEPAEPTSPAPRLPRRAPKSGPLGPLGAPPVEPEHGGFAPPVPPELGERAAEQVAASKAAAGAREARDRVVADLAAAAEALRRGPTIVPAPSDPPTRVARGTGGRQYPPLRGALVKLAHDDAMAAARLIVDLLPAQWKLIDRPVDYDLTIREFGTLAITVSAGRARVRPVLGPRSGDEAEFHMRTDALTLAEMLAGVGPRPRRFTGRVRVNAGPRKLRPFQALIDSPMSLEQLTRAGADLDPALAMRCMAYAIPSAWTKGHTFTVAETFTDGDDEETVYLTALDGAGMAVATDPPAKAPDATVVIPRSAFRALIVGENPPTGERPTMRGDHMAADQLRAWAERVRRGDLG